MRYVASPVLIMMFAVGCSLASSAGGWEPVPVGDLTADAASVAPAEWATTAPDLWPATVPAPTFLKDQASSSVSSPDGHRSVEVKTNAARPSDDDVAAYIALLLSEGFFVDSRAASDGWFVRDGFEWIRLGNLQTAEYLAAGDYSAPDPMSAAFQVRWTTDPIRITGYCRIIEVGGNSCRE